MSEPHEVVKLLLARIESHPEEFEGGMSNRHTRWRKALEDVFSSLTDEEAKPLKSALNKVRLDEVHKDVMDELLNGDERRRMEEKETEYEAELIRKQLAAQANQLYPNAQALGLAPGKYGQAVQNEMLRMGSQRGVGVVGQSPTSIWLDESTSIGAITTSTTEPTLSPSAINQIKKALGLKSRKGE